MRYGTESGFYAPKLFAQPNVGLADFGTRIRLVFTPVAAGVELFVPVEVFSGGLHLELVQAGPNGDSAGLPLIHAASGVAQIIHPPGDQAYAVYEVLSAGPTATIPVAVMFNGNPPNFPPPGAVTVSVSLVPIGGLKSMTASIEAPLPRFVDTSVPQLAFSIDKCIPDPFKCEAKVAAPTVRSKGITELVGDLVLFCTGGFPTQKGAPIPATDIQVSLNTSVTSRILAAQAGLSEATLLIDEPGSGPVRSCTANLAGNSCPETGTGFGCQSPYFTQPNVFLGWQSDSKTIGFDSKTIVFKDVPIDPPGPGVTRFVRITNVRADASKASGASITMTVSVTGPQSPDIDKDKSTLKVAMLKPGLGAVDIASVVLKKCESLNAGLLTGGLATAPSTSKCTKVLRLPSSRKVPRAPRPCS